MVVKNRPTLRELVAQTLHEALIAGCFPAYVSCWPQSLHDAITASFLTGKKLTEPQLTRVLIAIDYHSALPITKVITDALGLKALDYVPMHPREVQARPKGERRSIDCALAAPAGFAAVMPIFGEIKMGASVNGGWGYCPVHGEYSNQLICYADNCWTDIPRNERKMVWIGPGKYRAPSMRSKIKGAITTEDEAKYGISRESFNAQQSASWDAYIALEDLRDAAMTGNATLQSFGILLGHAIKTL